MTLHVALTARTAADIRALKAWGIDNWGPARTREFLGGLREAIDRLTSHPHMGRTRRSLHPDLRSVIYRGHVIFHANKGEWLIVIGVIHERRNQAALDFADRIDD